MTDFCGTKRDVVLTINDLTRLLTLCEAFKHLTADIRLFDCQSNTSIEIKILRDAGLYYTSHIDKVVLKSNNDLFPWLYLDAPQTASFD